MKLRLLNNSIRLRLGQGEVTRIAAGESIAQQLEFPGGAVLRYSLEAWAKPIEVSAQFSNNRLTVVLPIAIAREWATSDRIGIEASQRLSSGESLRILIEKDFKCMDAAGESSPDAFPNPSADCDR
jgi:hypothetical protein